MGPLKGSTSIGSMTDDEGMSKGITVRLSRVVR